MTVSELKKLLNLLPDNADVYVCNGHSVWNVLDYEYTTNNNNSEYIGIVLENSNMPK